MSRCPKSKRGHSWGGRDAVVAASGKVTCIKCGATGIVSSHGIVVEVKS